MRVLHRPNGSCTVLPRQQFRQPSPLSAFSQVQAKQLKPALVRIGRKVGEEVRSLHHIVGKRAQRGAVGLQIGDFDRAIKSSAIGPSFSRSPMAASDKLRERDNAGLAGFVDGLALGYLGQQRAEP